MGVVSGYYIFNDIFTQVSDEPVTREKNMQQQQHPGIVVDAQRGVTTKGEIDSNR